MNGNPNIFGFMVAEEAVDCKNEVMNNSTFSGQPSIYYDCEHPPNPWATAKERLWWHEVE